MYTERVQFAIDKLEVLETGDWDAIEAIGDATRGICFHIEHLVGIKYLRKPFRSWEHYSGNIDYPVPTVAGLVEDDWYVLPGEEALELNTAAHAYLYKDNKYSGEYGALRRDLARHIREDLEQLLAQLLAQEKQNERD